MDKCTEEDLFDKMEFLRLINQIKRFGGVVG